MQRQDWTPETNMQQALVFKEEGNAKFALKNYKQALRAYHKAMLHLSGIVGRKSAVAAYSKEIASQKVSNDSQQLKFVIFLNMAQIYITEGKFSKGLEVLAKAEAIKQSAKLYYRKTICLMKVHDLDKAKEELKKCVTFDESMRQESDRILKQIKELQKRQDDKAKKVYQNFFK